MPRTARQTTGGYVYQVLNRGVGRMTLFEKKADYEAFERVLARTLAKHGGVRLLTYCAMPNHWHLVLWPKGDDLGPFIQRLTLTHTRRWCGLWVRRMGNADQRECCRSGRFRSRLRGYERSTRG